MSFNVNTSPKAHFFAQEVLYGLGDALALSSRDTEHCTMELLFATDAAEAFSTLLRRLEMTMLTSVSC